MGNTIKTYLLYPPISKMERYSSKIGEAGGCHIPLGVLYLASYLMKNDIHVKVTDGEANNLTVETIIEEIEKFKPDFIGISSTTVAFHRALECAAEIKKKYKNAIIILGGPHITSNVNHAMSYDVFDYGVIGEGELTLTELLKALKEGVPIEAIKGIAYKDKNKRIVMTAKREYVEDLDSLPFPDFNFIKDISLYQPPPSNYKLLPVISMITSRGCPYQCTFCDRNVFGQKYRERSAENIFQEIKYLHSKYNIREIAFVDDTFFLNKKRIYKLFELLNREKIYLSWSCAARINNVNYDFLKFVKSQGCWSISFGIESGDSKILKTIKKGIEIEQIKNTIDWCYELGITTKGFFMIGHPTESIGSIDKTIKLACSLKLSDIVATINTPIPGSTQYKEIEKYGVLDKTDWSQFNYWRPVFVPSGLCEDVLLKKQKEIYRKFYLRPRIIIRYLKSTFTKGGIKRFITLSKASVYLFLNIKK